MSEKLISANEVLKYTVLAGEIRNQYMEVVPAYFVREAPAVDAVEVVRCRDCKYWGDEEGIAEGRDFRYARCNVHNYFRYGEHIGWCPKEDDFCSFGERREEDEVD